jgi:disulfide bond formation protein DsbB
MNNVEKKESCRVCLSIRIFLFSVFGLIIVALIDRDLVSGIAKLSPFAIAVSIVSILGLFAILKVLVELKQLRSKSTK